LRRAIGISGEPLSSLFFSALSQPWSPRRIAIRRGENAFSGILSLKKHRRGFAIARSTAPAPGGTRYTLRL
jgi:hypothetical protein